MTEPWMNQAAHEQSDPGNRCSRLHRRGCGRGAPCQRGSRHRLGQLQPLLFSRPEEEPDRQNQASDGGANFDFREVDFSRRDHLEHALAGVDLKQIIHLGAQPGVRYSLQNPDAYAQANLTGHLNILELARGRGTEHLVYASSSSVYGGNEKVPFSVEDAVDHPVSLYAATKRADELMSESYAHLYRLPQTGLRFFTVYGPWGRPDMMPWIFTSRILRGEPIPVFNHGEMERDFTYIDDIAQGVLAALDRPPVARASANPGGSKAPHAIYNLETAARSPCSRSSPSWNKRAAARRRWKCCRCRWATCRARLPTSPRPSAISAGARPRRSNKAFRNSCAGSKNTTASPEALHWPSSSAILPALRPSPNGLCARAIAA